MVNQFQYPVMEKTVKHPAKYQDNTEVQPWCRDRIEDYVRFMPIPYIFCAAFLLSWLHIMLKVNIILCSWYQPHI